eukprot:4964819-Pyramimonas_sp.AAC.1
MRLCVEPLRLLLADKFTLAADEFEAAQRASEFDQPPGPAGAGLTCRFYRILGAATNVHE